MKRSILPAFSAVAIAVCQLASHGGLAMADDAPPPKFMGAEIWAVDRDSGKERLVLETDLRITNPAADGGLLFVGTEKGLIAVNPKDGRTKWRNDKIGRVWFQPAARKGLVCVTSGLKHFVHAFDYDGKLLWKHDLGEHERVTSPLLLSGDTLLFGSSGEYVTALKADSGQVLWRSRTSHWSGWLPCVADGVVYVRAYDRIVAFDLATGRKTWQHEGQVASEGSALAVAKGTIYFTDHGRFTSGHYAMAKSIKDNKVRWKNHMGPAAEAPIVAGNLVLFAIESNLYGLDTRTGKQKWRTLISSGTGQVGIRGGNAYCTDFFGRVYCVDTETGRKKWISNPPDGLIEHQSVNGPLCIVGKTIYVSRSKYAYP